MIQIKETGIENKIIETCEWCKFAGKRNCDKKERGKNSVRCADYKLSQYAKKGMIGYV